MMTSRGKTGLWAGIGVGVLILMAYAFMKYALPAGSGFPVGQLPQPAQTGDANTSQATTSGDRTDTAAEVATPAPQVAMVAPEPTTPPVVPRIDEVRVETDGLSVIAGRAAPSSQVILFVDDDEVARLTADPSGAFAGLAQLDDPGDGGPRVLSIGQVGADGQTLPSDETVILAPVSRAADEQTAQLAGDTGAEPLTEQANIAPEHSTPTDTATEQVPQAEAPVEPEPADTQPDTTQAAPETTPARVAVLKSDADGVRVIAPAAPSVQTDQVALDAISYSDTGDLRLQGRARGGADQVRVYLDNRPVATLPVTSDGGWRGDLPDIDTGVFTLRLDEVDGDGRVTSRIETPLKREDPDLLQAALGTNAAPVSAITVQEGNTLWAIARDRYGEGPLYVRVFEANRDSIRDPDLIYPGQVLSLPSD